MGLTRMRLGFVDVDVDDYVEGQSSGLITIQTHKLSKDGPAGTSLQIIGVPTAI